MSEAAFIDAKCRKCGAHIGWHGRVVDRPACRLCGDKPPLSTLQADQEEMDNFRELLLELRDANPGWDKWQKSRVAAGLTLRQACKLLRTVTPTDLSAIERGEKRPSVALADRLSDLYSNGGYVEARAICQRCEGDGEAHSSDRPFEWSGPGSYPGPCPDCGGSGKVFTHCNVCGRKLLTEAEDKMGMCEKCSEE